MVTEEEGAPQKGHAPEAGSLGVCVVGAPGFVNLQNSKVRGQFSGGECLSFSLCVCVHWLIVAGCLAVVVAFLSQCCQLPS